MFEDKDAAYIEVAGSTRSGSCKENEDAFGYRAESFDSADIAVVDGAGHVCGKSVADFSNALVHSAMRYLRIYDDPERALRMVEEREAASNGGDERAAMMLASVRGCVARVAWKGDVCAWRIGSDGSSMERVTTPHRKPRGSLTRWVGAESRGARAVADVVLHPGECLLIASDGVFPDAVGAKTPASDASTLDDLAIDFIGGAPGADDATVVLVRCGLARNRLRGQPTRRRLRTPRKLAK